MSKVIVATDRATRMAVAKAVKDESAETVADFLLNEVMLREGCPSEIWSDRGGAFMSEVVGVVSKVVWIKVEAHFRISSSVQWIDRTFPIEPCKTFWQSM